MTTTIAEILHLAEKIEREEMRIDEVVDGLIDPNAPEEALAEEISEEELEEEQPLPAYQREGREGRMAIKELREVPLPKPVHTRLYSRMSNDTGAQVTLPERSHDQPSSHQVILGKREPPAVPLQHIINLKR